MTFDELRHAWQAQDCRARVSVDPAALTKLIRREQRSWGHMILRRDVLEVTVAFLMIPVCVYWAIAESLPPMFLAAGAMLFVGGFFVVDRILQRPRRPRESHPLFDFIKRSIDQADHQIWLLRNVFWWYLLPPAIGIAAVLGYVTYLVLEDGLSSRAHLWAVLFIIGVAVLNALAIWGVYILNQRAVRKELLPRKLELEELLRMLESPE